MYLAPNITSDWVAVIIIFFLSGLGIHTEEFGKAMKRPLFNIYVQTFNFGIVSGIVYGVSRALLHWEALPETLAEGMVLCSCLPLTVSMVFVLTKSAEGDEALAVFHAAVGNILGVFVSPVLITVYLGVREGGGDDDGGSVHALTILIKLLLRVVVPLMIGQLCRFLVPSVCQFMVTHKRRIKVTQECILAFIVYCTFCDTFTNNGMDATVQDIFLMIAMQGGLLLLVMVLAWATLTALFGTEPKLVAMGLFGCTHKTVALGIPLINSMFTNDPRLGLYTLPLLIWHPLQLLLGTAIAPRVAKYVNRREMELVLQRQQELLPLQVEEDGRASPT